MPANPTPGPDYQAGTLSFIEAEKLPPSEHYNAGQCTPPDFPGPLLTILKKGYQSSTHQDANTFRRADYERKNMVQNHNGLARRREVRAITQDRRLNIKDGKSIDLES